MNLRDWETYVLRMPITKRGFSKTVFGLVFALSMVGAHAGPIYDIRVTARDSGGNGGVDLSMRLTLVRDLNFFASDSPFRDVLSLDLTGGHAFGVNYRRLGFWDRTLGSMQGSLDPVSNVLFFSANVHFRGVFDRFSINHGEVEYLPIPPGVAQNTSFANWQARRVPEPSLPDPEPRPVPEPSLLVLFGIGLLSLCLARTIIPRGKQS